MNKKKNLNIKETFDLAIKKHQNNYFDIAEKLYREILKTNPDQFESNFALGTLLVQTKKFDMAKPFIQKAIQINPNYAAAYSNLGYIERKLGEQQKSISSYQKAIQINPNYIIAYNNLAIIFKELGELKKSIKYYEKSIQINANNISTINGLSGLFKLICLDNITKDNSDRLKKLFLILFRRNDINHTDIFKNAKLLLFIEKNYNEVQQIVNSESFLLKNKFIKSLTSEELFHLILQKSIIKDLLLEKILTKIRKEILFDLIKYENHSLKVKFEFLISIAEQCFLNEYCFSQSKKEIDSIKQLKNIIENEEEINEIRIAILSSYIPLNTSKVISNKLLNYKSENILFNDLISMQIREPLREKELLNSIGSFGNISDTVSKKVRKQYEENPYPRWRFGYKKSPSNPLIIINNQIEPNKIELNNKFNNSNILIAGCGTGRQIAIANQFLNANILGIDLSLSSLAYAKRKTEELDFKNIEFLHGDILQLRNLNRKFDIIECVGTLHHMKDPLEGLQVLLDLLEPHGFMKLGLYSEISRKYVVKARDFIKKKGFKDTIEDIRNFRESIVKEKNNQLFQKMFNIRDFYSTSMVRDLMFHVQEHRFTIPEIFKILKDQNLEFLGFTDLLIKDKFLKLFPNDKKNISLENWNQFEISNPDTFSNMYQFWVRKAKA